MSYLSSDKSKRLRKSNNDVEVYGDVEFGNPSLLAITSGALVYSFRFYLSGMIANQNVKMINLDGVYPIKENKKIMYINLLLHFMWPIVRIIKILILKH